MILVFGAILMNIQLGLDKAPPGQVVHFAPDYEIGVGGKAALQGLAAAKAGARAASVGHIGDDHYGKNVLLRLRQHGVVTSGVARHETLPTGSFIQIGRKNPQIVLAPGASAKANHEQIPADIMNNNTVLLIQDEFPMAQNEPLLPKAKKKKTPVIMNCGVRNDLAEYDLGMIDYVIVDEKHPGPVGHMMRCAPEKLVLLKDGGGCSGQTKAGEPIDLPPPALRGVSWVDPACAEDAFCGAFAAGILAGLPYHEVLRMAAVARVLTAGKRGGYRSLPYPDDIRTALKS